jgi:hypothetical protein
VKVKKAAAKQMENARNLDMDMDMLALALLTPQACNVETPWTVAHPPPQESESARSADASRRRQQQQQPKSRQVRKRQSDQSKCRRKSPQKSRKRTTKQVAPNSTVQITQRLSDEQAEMNTASAETAEVETFSYAVADVLEAVLDAFDVALSGTVSGPGNSTRGCFRLQVIRNLMIVCLQRKLEANAPHNEMSVEDITGHVFGLLQRFGISIQ